jgi:hypothetical protein
VVLAALALGAATPFARAQAEVWVGRSLTDALRALQARGLRLVFTSVIVTPELQVQTEPRAGTARQQLEELLAPHGLKAQDGPGGIILVIRAAPRIQEPRARPPARATPAIDRPSADPAKQAPHAGVILSEYVTVNPPQPNRHDRGVASEVSLDRSQLMPFYGGLSDDAIRAVQTLPRVSVVDDFRSDFSVRGSPFRHVGVVVDGVSTPWLQHTAYGRSASGSLTMLTTQVVEDATLRVGAYPHRHGDRLGAELDLTLREGSRAGFALRGAVGGTNATVIGEGPIGAAGQAARGSWLVAARQSYLEWPPDRADSTRAAFGFSDALAKVVYDIRASQRIDVSVLGGVSSVDGEDSVAASEPGGGTNRAAVANLDWRSTFGQTFLLSQRVYVVKHRFLNQSATGEEENRGASEAAGYRADVARPVLRGLLEAGMQVERTRSRHRSIDAFESSSWQRSGYAHFAWNVTPAIRLSPGLRVTSSSLLPRPAITRWLLGEWSVRPGWTVNASAGVSHQPPELRYVNAYAGPPPARSERAAYVDVGIEHPVGHTGRWQLVVFDRKESDILREPDLNIRVVGESIVKPADSELSRNSLRGSSRGVELVVERQAAVGLSGWAAYSYGRSRYTDTDRHETFWADFDQRHGANLFGVYRFSHASVGATLRAGTNFPIPAYVTARDGGLFVADRRNQVRLPAYARLDVRADRDFESFGRRLRVFVEVINVTNRVNVGAAPGSIRPSTGEAIGFTRTLFPRRVSAGLLIEF